jgi:hypothetical protein
VIAIFALGIFVVQIWRPLYRRRQLKLKDTLDQRAVIAVLKRVREEARLTRKELSQRIGQREMFVSLVEKGIRTLHLPELRPYSLACGRDPLEVYALILRETALYTTQQQAGATARLAARRNSAATKKKAATTKKRK